MLARSVSDARAITSAAVGPSWPIRMSSGPSSRNEKPRSAWSSCIEETPTSITTPSTASRPMRRADFGEIGKAVLDQRQPTIRTIDQIESAGDRRCGRDRCRSTRVPGRVENGAAIAAGAEGGVDIDDRLRAARASRPPRGRARRHDAARPGSCAHLRRMAVQGTGVGHETAHRASNARASTGRSGHGTAASTRARSPIPGRKP